MDRHYRGARWNCECVLQQAVICIIVYMLQYYGGMSFKILIHFPPNYPYVPPVIKFESPCFHPNVDIMSGAICLDILQVCVPRL
jgi:ubiquitin-protein ligase